MRPAALAAVFLGLNLVDAITTAWLVGHGAGEANPVMAAALSLGVTAFLCLKLGLALLAALLTARFAVRALRALCVAFAGIAAWQAALCFLL